MEGYWSLTIFTLLGQAAAGLLGILSLSTFPDRDYDAPSARICGYLTLGLLALGAFASLIHLGDPLLCIYTLNNIGSSWLSREILFMGLTGAATLAWIFFQRIWLLWLSAFLGLCFVYVMSRVYTLPTVPFWNSGISYGSFLATSLLLGASIMLLVQAYRRRRQAEDLRAVLRGWIPPLMALALLCRLVLIPLQLLQNDRAAFSPLWIVACMGLLLLGGGLGMLLLVRTGLHTSPPNAAGEAKSCPCPLFWRASTVCALIWLGELCGRLLFYKGYTWFGM